MFFLLSVFLTRSGFLIRFTHFFLHVEFFKNKFQMNFFILGKTY